MDIENTTSAKRRKSIDIKKCFVCEEDHSSNGNFRILRFVVYFL